MVSQMYMSAGTIAIAMVKRQVMIVQTVRPHTKHDTHIDVHAYAPFGERVFIATSVPEARIPASHVLAVVVAPSPPPRTDEESVDAVTQDMLELSCKAFAEYRKISLRHQKKYERMWSAMMSH
ncbi:hypothetical protein APHAL10511_002220 [Amanita phalloides]|nr:hypothetical protein APHAL10511_002220 [Amanita phalloides]